MPSPTHSIALLIPAFNEAESIGLQLAQVPRDLFDQIIVVDNGSTDGTASVASAAGAEAHSEPCRGYGQACLTGLAHLRPEITAVVFMDGDLSDDPADAVRLIQFFNDHQLDLLVGSRVLGKSEPGSLTPVQRFGNWLTTRLLRWLWGVSFTDLGPFRVVSREALDRLQMRDRNFGWTVEMQAKAAVLGLRCGEIPVNYRRRRFGQSKISGTIMGSARAGAKILGTVLRCWTESRTTK